MKSCPKCGYPNSDESKFCRMCGVELPDEKPKPIIPTCPKCKMEVKTEYDYCPYCGNNLKEQVEVNYYCSNCGNKITKNDESCPKCGYSKEQSKKNNETLKIFVIVISAIAILLRLVNPAFFFFKLIVKIPMFIYAVIKLSKNKKISTGFKICYLIFVSVIAGIILLVMKDDENEVL